MAEAQTLNVDGTKNHDTTIELENFPPHTTSLRLAADQDELPKGYFWSPFFLGSLAAVCFSLAAAVGGFALVAPILSQVNADIGPDKNIIWVALVYTICLTVGLTLVGRLSDLFGRRWFFVSGTILGLIGCIVCATAQSVNVLIGGEVLVGLSAAAGVSYPFVLGELIPMKYRFAGNSIVYLFQLPTSCFGPAIAYSFILHTSAGWRWCYYYLIIWNGIALLLWILFYHPPTFAMKHGSQRKLDFLKSFDYIGTVLFVAGIVLFLIGLSWGGSAYPWKSARVVATIVVGGVMLIAFGFWEVFFPGTEPLVPVHLFKNLGWVASTVVLGICGGVFYAFAIIWPSMVSTLYAKPNDPMYTGYVSCIVGLGITVGQVVGGFVAMPLGRVKWQTIITFVLGAVFLTTTAACNEKTKAAAIALLFVGTILIGWADSLVTTITTIEIRNQEDIGIAAGIVGGIRSLIGAICQAVYISILYNRLAHTIPAQVPPALIQAGLPASSVPAFLQAAAAGVAGIYDDVQGLTPAILEIGTAAYKHASLDAYRTVFFSSIAFSGVGILMCWFVPNVDSRMTGEVSATLHARGSTKVIRSEA